MKNKIFISFDIIKENDIEYFLSYSKNYLIKAIQRLMKNKRDVKIILFFNINKEYQKFFSLKINEIKGNNIKIVVNFVKNNQKKLNFNMFKNFKKSRYNLFFKLTGDSIIDENFLLRILKYFDEGYTSIFSNLIEVYEKDFQNELTKKKFDKNKIEKLIYKFLKNNTDFYTLKKSRLIKRSNFFIIESSFPRLLAFSNNKSKKTLFINNFHNLGKIILKSNLDENFKPRYKITDKIVSEINNSPLFNNEKKQYRYKLFIRKFPKKDQNENVTINYQINYSNFYNEDFFKNFLPLEDMDVDFAYYKSVYIYYVYNEYKKKFKLPLYFILFLSLLPFPIRKFIYYQILKKIYFKSDPFYDHTIDRLLFHQSRNNLNFISERFTFLKKKSPNK